MKNSLRKQQQKTDRQKKKKKPIKAKKWQLEIQVVASDNRSCRGENNIKTEWKEYLKKNNGDRIFYNK